MLCRYADMFGKPNQGIHAIRFANIAVVDAVLTILLGILISYFTHKSIWIILLCLFGLGIITHRVFCVRTTIDRLLSGWQLGRRCTWRS